MSPLSRVLAFLRPHRRQVVLALALSLLALAANVSLLAIAGYLLAAAALQPLLVTLAFPMTAVRVLGVSRALLRYGERLVAHRATLTLLADLRVWLFGRLAPLAPAALIVRRSGDLLARLTGDLDELQNVYLRIFSPAVVAIVALGVTAITFAVFSPILALAAVLFLLAGGVGAPLLALRLARGLGARQLAARNALHNHLIEGIQGMPDLLAFGRAESQAALLADLEGQAGRLQRRQARIAGVQGAIGDFSTSLAVLAILVLAIPIVRSGQIGGLYLGFLTLLMLASFEAVQPLGAAFATLGRSMTAATRLFEVADAEPQVQDPPEALPVPLAPSLRFDDVRFAYEPDAAPVLDGVGLTVHPGHWVAVVGPSGAGKSTLASLALRFWDPQGGGVYLGDHAVSEYGLDDLRAAFAVVGQDTTLFTDTLRNNLRIARPGATDAELIEALEAAQLRHLLDVLPGGLDGWLGEQGLTLSGGERQRLAVARALLKEAPVLILDEATANLDPESEACLLAAVRARAQRQAVLVITHRLVAMEWMSEIVVLDHGQVVERGSHAQLSAGDGLYRALFEAQRQLLALTA